MVLRKDRSLTIFVGYIFYQAFLAFVLRLPAYLLPLSTLQQKAWEGNYSSEAPLCVWNMGWLVSPAFMVSYLLLYASLVFWYGERILQERNGSKSRGHGFGSRIKLIRSLFALYTFAFVSYYILVRMAFFRVEHDYLISLVMATTIYWLGYREYGLAQPVGQTTAIPAGKKYNSSSLTPTAAASLVIKLKKYMQEKQPYLNNDLRRSELADTLGISSHHLSQIINEHHHKTFNQFINEYRVEEAKKLPASKAHQEAYIIEIAY